MELFTIIILFAFCFLLAGIEIFIMPGFGFAGIGACCCLVIANILTFSHFGITTGLLVMGISLILCGLFCYWLMHSRTIEKYSLIKALTPRPPDRNSYQYVRAMRASLSPGLP